MHSEDIKGHLVMIMAPMGSGKGSLIAHARAVFPQVSCTTSCTTREKRPSEQEGKDYYFLSKDEFMRKIEAGEFMEWAEFSGNLYGTLTSELMTRLVKGEVVISEIDLQGVEALRSIIPEESRTLVYIEAGEWPVLKARALARAPISQEHLALRYERYLKERAYRDQVDVVIHNNDGESEHAQKQLEGLLQEIITRVASHT
jgi:guanylate kinase